MVAKTEKLPFWQYTHSKWSYVGKVPKINFEKLTWKIDQFLSIFGPKSSVFNRDCLENRKILNRKNYENQKRVK